MNKEKLIFEKALEAADSGLKATGYKKDFPARISGIFPWS